MENVAKRYETMRRYGRLVVGLDTYALLRPTRFEREHYKFTENEVSFYVTSVDELWDGGPLEFYNPHVLTICNEGFHVDMLPHPDDIVVVIYGEEEQENTLNDFRPIDMIATADEDLPIE